LWSQLSFSGEIKERQRNQRNKQPEMHVYEVRLRKDKRGVDLISDALPFGRLWYDGPEAAANAIDYAKFRSRSHDAVIRVFDVAGRNRLQGAV
jgi:hypothetical protein